MIYRYHLFEIEISLIRTANVIDWQSRNSDRRYHQQSAAVRGHNYIPLISYLSTASITQHITYTMVNDNKTNVITLNS